jgi:DNA-binding transcriptional LysR family regulator
LLNIRIDILTLQLFVAIVEEQSIAKAAEKKHIAVSAVSRRISDMEEMLKVDLLYRHSKGIEPTSAGIALLDHARTILGNLAQLQTDLVGYREGARGHIRLSVNKSAILESLADELGQFLQVHPLIRVDLEENISPDIIQAVIENRADLGIYGGNILAPTLQIFPYRHDRLVALIPATHHLAGRETLRFSDLIDQEFISLEKGSSIDAICVKAAADLGRQLKLRIRVSGFDAVFRLVQAQMGIGVVPQEIIEGRLGNGDLVGIPLEEPWAHRTLMLAVRDRASLPPAARLLVDHLLKSKPSVTSPAAKPCEQSGSSD